MTTLEKRLEKLEEQFHCGNKPPDYCVMGYVGMPLGEQTCMKILDECGYLPRSGFVWVSLCSIPWGLTAEEAKRFLREHGAELTGLKAADPSKWPPCRGELPGLR
jgi:hypothetical protein